MSWSDPARLSESAEDRELREELRGLLGGPAANFFSIEPTPELVALAEDLRREALRRRHTARQKPSWMLLAAALPLALAVVGTGVWGFQQKRRAEALALNLARQDQEHQQQLVAVSNQLKSEREAREAFVRAIQKDSPKGPQRLGKELVIPVDRSPIPAAADTQLVKGH